MLNYIFYGTFLRSWTLPTSRFQRLASYNSSLKKNTQNPKLLSNILQYAAYLECHNNTSHNLFKQYYSINWISEINFQLSYDEKNNIHLFLREFLSRISIYNAKTWDINILSVRIFNMLRVSQYIFDHNDPSPFAKEYFKVILQQSIYLRRKLNKSAQKRDYILFIIRTLYTQICFLEERKHLKSLLNVFEKKLTQDFYKDGGHISRNASFQLKIVSELIALRELAVSSGISLPNNVQSVISLSIDYLNFMRHPDGKLAIFNGSYETETSHIDSILNTSISKVHNNRLIKMKDTGFYRVTAPNMTLLIDIQNFANRHQYDYDSMLAFELSIAQQRVFINCGSGDELGEDWGKAMKQPAAHNMPIIDIPNLVPSLKNPVIIGKKTINAFVAANSQGTTLEAAQSYEFGKTGHITHHRHLTVFKTGKVLRGEDTFHMVSQDKKIIIENPNCYIRFHLAPQIIAKSSGTSVILKIPNQGDWMFTVGSGKIMLEPSIYLGTASLQETRQIVVKLSLNKPQVKFRWTLQELTSTQDKVNQSLSSKESQKIVETI